MSVILLALLVLQSFAANSLYKVSVDYPQALCLDGSKPAYYVSEGDPHKFVISFEGGGWCGSSLGVSQTIENCYNRSSGINGSSLYYQQTWEVQEGIFSKSPRNIFRDWTVIQLKYCDGTGHQGYRKEPINFGGKFIYFKGQKVTLGQLHSINQRFNIFSLAKKIVITGQSAGGLAVYQWVNHIADRAPKLAKVHAIADSGIFLDSMNYATKESNYRKWIQNFMSLSNMEVDPPTPECIKANPTEKWKCMFAANLYPYIKVPFFSIQSLYDDWSIPYILGIHCNDGQSLLRCQYKEMEYIQQYKTNVTKVMRGIAAYKKNGVWGLSCSDHQYTIFPTFYSPNYRIPVYSNNSLASAIASWLNGQKTNHAHIDTASWPFNQPCSGLGLRTQQQ